jgi:hypothetical protein
MVAKTIERREHSMRWNSTTITSKMQNEIGPKDFGVCLQILCSELLLSDSNEVVLGKSGIQSIEKMFAWVLWALTAYAEKVGLLERGYLQSSSNFPPYKVIMMIP